MNIAYYVCAEIRFAVSATVVRDRAAEGRERVCVSEHAQDRQAGRLHFRANQIRNTRLGCVALC